ncbi:hypothetical protein DBIPINDM_007600 (plasmid) [Mesorhizobium sp. AR02]|uniref:hypothetical protein n=1 Tax=Mesorhizobium sp. AR02 TaxID=2865837 RepID=UPI00215F1FBD|nr:hypothetical protein [Mesorhizobium sp. AR02]UVK50278.1 hypothetical protein DBIPINDM_007600 [Mesorhizobium sp. AR02]
MSDLGQIRFLSESRPPAQSDCPIGQLALTPTIAHHHLVPIDRLGIAFDRHLPVSVIAFRRSSSTPGCKAMRTLSSNTPFLASTRSGSSIAGALCRLKITRQGS